MNAGGCKKDAEIAAAVRPRKKTKKSAKKKIKHGYRRMEVSFLIGFGDASWAHSLWSMRCPFSRRPHLVALQKPLLLGHVRRHGPLEVLLQLLPQLTQIPLACRRADKATRVRSFVHSKRIFSLQNSRARWRKIKHFRRMQIRRSRRTRRM